MSAKWLAMAWSGRNLLWFATVGAKLAEIASILTRANVEPVYEEISLIAFFDCFKSNQRDENQRDGKSTKAH